MIPTPEDKGDAFLMPVARVMSLYQRYSGKDFVPVTHQPDGLDVTASRTDNKVYLHVVNTRRDRSVHARISLANLTAVSGNAYEIAVPPEDEITRYRRNLLNPKKRDFIIGEAWEFPAASVTAVELDCRTP